MVKPKKLTRWEQWVQTARWIYYGKVIPLYETSVRYYNDSVIESFQRM